MSYKGSVSQTGTAKVRRKTALTLSPLSIDVEEGDAVTFTGKLSEASGPNIGVGIANKTVHLYVDSTDVAQAQTASDGTFSINYTFATGDFQYHVEYKGD